LQRQEYIRYEDKPLQTAGGRRIEVEFVSNVYLVDGKKVIQCNIRDISERIRAEKALRDSEAFNTSVLDSLAEHIAVLDAGGTILAVNRAWRDFATANGATAALAHSLGLNYLAVCGESSLHPHGEEGNAAHAGIRTVLAGAQPEFHLEYPCHSPTERRWFMLHATPLRGAQAGAVVSHENITARKEAEMALRISLQEKEALLKEVHHRVKNNLQVVMSLLRLEAGRNRDSVAHAVLKEMQGRILAMALLHETLYRTQNFARVDLAGYLREIAT